MARVPTARDLMATFFVELRPETDIFEAIDVLLRRRASGAPVINELGQLVGLLTEKDCLRVMSNDAYATLARGRVADYMSEIKGSVEADMDLFRVAEHFLQSNFAVLPVMQEGTPIGRISRQDMLRGIQRLQRSLLVEQETLERDLQREQNPTGINDLQNLFAKHKPENVAALLSLRHGE